jgi:predicted MFS family arabinose efflux permease
MFAVTALLIRPVAGPAMDYFRKSRLLSLSIGLVTVSYVGYGCAGSIGMLIAVRLIHGVGIGVTTPLCLALASNALPAQKIASGISVFSLGTALATAVGPSVGLRLSALVGYNTTFFILSVLLAASFLLTLRIRTRKPETAAPFRLSLKNIVVPEANRTVGHDAFSDSFVFLHRLFYRNLRILGRGHISGCFHGFTALSLHVFKTPQRKNRRSIRH